MSYSLFNGLVSTIKDTAALFSITISDAVNVTHHVCSHARNIYTAYQKKKYWTSCLLALVMCFYLACIAGVFLCGIPMLKIWLIGKLAVPVVLASVTSKTSLLILCNQLIHLSNLIS
ncbi:Uncharacterised protein [Yersinia enterocolitica]|uniref:Uncharacterized protein n=1 Tax=Yersinia enterocolitica TaxID=630 RepID=A0A9P1V6X9_YEREN|nr:Uncharacterised protein [Yersinia enterocolitica]